MVDIGIHVHVCNLDWEKVHIRAKMQGLSSLYQTVVVHGDTITQAIYCTVNIMKTPQNVATEKLTPI